MALGTIMLYFGIAIFAASFTAVLAVVVFALLLLTYIRLVEEKEMSLRFGDEYSQYKQRIPFIIPRLWPPGKMPGE